MTGGVTANILFSQQTGNWSEGSAFSQRLCPFYRTRTLFFVLLTFLPEWGVIMILIQSINKKRLGKNKLPFCCKNKPKRGVFAHIRMLRHYPLSNVLFDRVRGDNILHSLFH